jgi:hypothetical protein
VKQGTEALEKKAAPGLKYKLLDFSLVRKVMLFIYDRIFKWYYDR